MLITKTQYWWCLPCFFVFALIVLGSGSARAQAVVRPQPPDNTTAIILIRSTLTALDQANKTGNYTVLRDLGSPAFRAANSSARLGQIFAKLRGRNTSIAPIVVLQPKFLSPAKVNQTGQLRLNGFFPSQPLAVFFDLRFEVVGNHWLMSGIGAELKPLRIKKSGKRATGKKKAN